MKKIKNIIIIVAFNLLAITTFAGGFIIVSPSGTNGFVSTRFNPYSLEVRSLKVNVDITDLVAVTTIEEVFYNPSSRNLQGWFLFPVPKGAVLKNFSMEINGKQMKAELLDAGKARKIYEDIVRKSLDPALLEYSNQSLFKVRIFPIEARKEKKIKITYTEILENDNNTSEYIFPLNTKKYSAKPLQNISFNINIKNKNKITTLYSPTHKTEVVRKGKGKAVVGYEAKTVKPDVDFKLFIGTANSNIGAANSNIGVSLLTYKEDNENGFFLMNINPGYVSPSDNVVEKDITFVLDVSGSMSGEKMKQARKAIKFCVDNLNKGDKFEIIKFSTVAYPLFGKRRKATKANRKKAEQFISDLEAIGGTNMEEAFELACKEKDNPSRPHMIVFITDGKPTIGETTQTGLMKKISKNTPKNTRIFTFGIGEDINTLLLDKITEKTRAYRSYITPSEDIEVKISNFYTKVSSPVLTDINIKFSKGKRISEMYPRNLPDLFKGSSLTVLGKFDKTGTANVILTGKVNGKSKKYTYRLKLNKGTDNDFVPVLWATRKIGFLLDQIRLNGSKKELVDEVTVLAKKYGIITPYTSYLILEDEKISLNNGTIRRGTPVFSNRMDENEQQNFAKKNKEEYKSINNVSGGKSIETSQEFQQTRQADKLADVSLGQSRMYYKDKKGRTQNFAKQVKNVQGRAVYQTGDKWIDLYSQNNNQKANRIKFAGKKYFKLLEKEPQIAQFYSLGKNVMFVYNKQLYEIYE